MSSRILVISGSDSSAGAGHQADLRTIYHHKLSPLSAITAITVQSDLSAKLVKALPAFLVEEQIIMALSNYEISAIKIGMLANAEITKIVAKNLKAIKNIPIILDPVLKTSSGKKLLDDKALKILVNDILPQIYCLTPNLEEAEILSNTVINNKETREKAARILQDKGCKNILIKGGHIEEDEACDYLFGEKKLKFNGKRFPKTIRGTGCILASAIACNLSLAQTLAESIHNSKKYTSSLIAAENQN